MSWPRPLASARRTEGARSVAPCFASQGVHGWDNRLSLEIFTRRLLWQQQSYVKTIIDEALRTPSAAVPRSPSAPVEDKHCRMLPTPPGTPRSVIDHQLDDAQGDAIVRLVKQCPSLTSIDIGFNNLDQQMALGVLKAARPYDNVTTLGFWSCKIHSAGAKQIADYVASSATVTSLDLEYK